MRAVQIADRWHRRTPGEKQCRCGTRDYPYASADHGAEQRWAVRWRDPEGKQRKKLFQKKPDAQRFAGKLKSSLDRGTYRDPSTGKTSFGKVAKKWREAVDLGHRAATRANNDRALRLHILPTFEHREIGSITRDDVQGWVTEKSATLAPGTVDLTYGVLRSVFAFAVGEYIPASPCDARHRAARVRLPAKAGKEVVPLTTDQVAALLGAAPDRYRAALLLAATSGLRQAELFGLEVGHVGDDAVTVRQQVVVHDDGVFEITPVKTASSRRIVPVPEGVVQAVRAHVKAFPVPPPTLVDTTGQKDTERRVRLVFATADGEPVQRSPWSRIWARTVKAANAALAEQGADPIPAGATLHSLRHTYASVLFAEGESLKAVQRRLGHSSATTTLDIYAHLLSDSAQSTRVAIQRRLGVLLQGTSQGTQSGESRGNEE
ncbi:site-specific integrase [Streptomyces olivaceus]|uniref:tyrosine-type recombinase/integrase n=1 Tax=Streptomyces olivaceus TaxID=47716 RepID=UPI0033316DE4